MRERLADDGGGQPLERPCHRDGPTPLWRLVPALSLRLFPTPSMEAHVACGRRGEAIGGDRKAPIGEERSTGHRRMAARVSLRGGLFIPWR
jgi:hypothetical protein